MIRYIVFVAEPYEGMYPGDADGSEEEPIPSYATHDEAVAAAKRRGLISPEGRRNEAEILAVRID